MSDRTNVTIVADSRNVATGDRITTFLLSNLMAVELIDLRTHRATSWSVRSSRTMPPDELRQSCCDTPNGPDAWYTPGEGKMGRGDILKSDTFPFLWKEAAGSAASFHAVFCQYGAHTELANMLLLPFLRYSAVVTTTEWGGFFAQRAVLDDEKHGPRRDVRLRVLEMRKQYEASAPVLLTPGEWHLPFVTRTERAGSSAEDCVKLSVARCARASTGKEGAGGAGLYDWLLRQTPMHTGPLEHAAEAAPFSGRFGNLVGWRSARKGIPGEANGDYTKKVEVVYVAGPFRAATGWGIEQNVRRAEQVALEVARRGYTYLCPHMNSRYFHGEGSEAYWIEATQKLMRRSDALVLVKGWEESQGTLGEIKEAKWLGMPVFERVEDLPCINNQRG